MRNKLVLLLAGLILAGCAVHPRFGSFDSTDQRLVLSELQRRRQGLKVLRAEANFTLAAPSGNVSVRGEVLYRSDSGWEVRIVGPLGMKMATVRIGERECILELPQSGVVTAVDATQPLEIPALRQPLPAPSDLPVMLLPTPDVNPAQGWRLLPGGESPDILVLVRERRSWEERLQLVVGHEPLRVLVETLTRGDEPVYRKTYGSRDDPLRVPERIDVESGDLKLSVRYRYREFKTAESVAPAGGF